jgi:septal ring factor EnvC (AmiA/AmiB activator)
VDPTLTVAIVGAIASIAVAVIANRFASRSARAAQRRTAEIERTKVDAEAYGRARESYDAALATQDRRIRELTAAMDSDRREYRSEIAECKSRIRELEEARKQDRRTLLTVAVWARQILVILRSHEIEFPPPPPELDAI